MALTVLVTGGAGFIGGHLVKRLVDEKEAHVVSIDSFDPFYDKAVKTDHWQEVVASLPHRLRPELLEIDVRDAEKLNRLFAERRFDIVIHAAARAGVRPSISDPAGYMDSNVTGTARLYEACRQGGVKKVIFTSSSSVYGDGTPSPFRESDPASPPDFQISPYAVSKRTGELLTYTFSRMAGWRSIILRLFTVYGPWQRPDLAISKFTRLLLEGSPLPVYGDGTTSRGYTHVDDIVDGVMSAVGWCLSSDDAETEVVNLGNDKAATLDELIDALQAATGTKADVERHPIPPGDVTSTCADLCHAKELLGYQPKVDFLEGLRTFVDWFRSRA